MLDVGCWMLVVGCWMLVVGCWLLDVGCWMLDDGWWMLDFRCWLPSPSALQRATLPFQPHRSRSAIQRTPHPQPRLLHHMRVNLRGAHVLVPEQFLNGSDIVAGFQQPRRKRMSQRMATGGLDDSSQTYRVLHRPLQTRLAGVVA